MREIYDLGMTQADLDCVGLPAREWALVGLNGNDIYSESRGHGQYGPSKISKSRYIIYANFLPDDSWRAPSFEKELAIVRLKAPGASDELATQIVGLVQQLRRAKLAKVPGVSETLDWAGALVALHASRLQPQIVQETLGCLIKDEGDLRKVRTEIEGGRLAVGSAA